MKVGFLVPPSSQQWSSQLSLFADEAPGHRLLVGEEAMLPELARLDALVAARVSPELIGGAAGLKALFVPLAGVNHLPLEALRSRAIRVFNIHANAEAVAQNALALILAFHGRVIEYHNDLAETAWHGFWVGKGTEDEWDSIYGLRCAILGTGAIGSALALLLKAFRCEIVGWRRRPDLPVPPGFDRVEASIETALEGADIVVSTLPLTAETRGLLSGKHMSIMKGAFLVNVGRGEVIDEESLYGALRDRLLRGAGLDVWYRYPSPGSTKAAPSRFPIHELPNVVLSPHIGGSERKASRAAVAATLRNLRSWLLTGESPNEIDLRAAY